MSSHTNYLLTSASARHLSPILWTGPSHGFIPLIGSGHNLGATARGSRHQRRGLRTTDLLLIVARAAGVS